MCGENLHIRTINNERVEIIMPSFGKKQKEESINDKMVRLFNEGKSVDEISKELAIKPDVITNVIRRRCGEDSIPETVIRSKNSMPQHTEEQTLKADMAVPETDNATEETEEAVPEQTEGMTKLERYLLEKEKQKVEALSAANTVEERSEPILEVPEVSMEGISTENLEPAFEEPAPAPTEPEESAEMDGISAEEIPVIAEDEPIEEHPATEYSAPEVAEEPTPAPTPAPAAFTVPDGVGGSAFDKMKAFAQSQIEANNAKIAELESKLSTVEDDYTAQLADIEKSVEDSKVTYEEVLTRGDKIAEQRDEIKSEHRAALARADEDYRKKLAELDEEYNNATAHANKVLAEKEEEINKVSDALEIEKENAKNSFLDNQSALTDIKKKIADEVDAVKAQINGIKEENAGYEKFMG
jgi:hypothetical protein